MQKPYKAGAAFLGRGCRSKHARLARFDGVDARFDKRTDRHGVTHPRKQQYDLDHYPAEIESQSQNKTEPGILDMDGNTALMYAAMRGHGSIISIFTNIFKHQRKALHLGQKNIQGLTALQLASKNKHDGCVRLLTREAQQFPNSLVGEFPDPKELERAPTPTKRKHKGFKMYFSSLEEGKIHDMIPENKTDFSSSITDDMTKKENENISGINSPSDVSQLPHINTTSSTGSLGSGSTFSLFELRKDFPPISKIQSEIEKEKNTATSLVDGIQGVIKSDPNLQDPMTQAELITEPTNMSSELSSEKCSILPLLAFQSVTQLNGSITSTTSDAWDWDLATHKRFTEKYRLDTGSRSLSESRGKLTDNLEAVKEKLFNSSDKLHEILPKDSTLSSLVGEAASSSSSQGKLSVNVNILSPLPPGLKDGFHLPPIRNTLEHYKRGNLASLDTSEQSPIKEEEEQSRVSQSSKSGFTLKEIKV
ncbi:uncharacterized protein LOC111085521 isoform X2 [Limulus polyphemus]|uniref:Uncharacterized protein LOC111085521 isoform X2 n=1 Tax=Limulus polyphemus TaxID=6850 RepID=A0ABM1S985_LIMPO|nr:uncharacterized protein LOC111085521 isoform X2 [Limulus polyphemus]